MIGDVLLCFLFCVLGGLAVFIFAYADRQTLTCPCGKRRLRNVVITSEAANTALNRWLHETCPDCSMRFSRRSAGVSAAWSGGKGLPNRVISAPSRLCESSSSGATGI